MSVNDFDLPPRIHNRRAALAVAHPGHELRVHGWLELARPIVCVLTDGSGHTGQSRLGSTTGLLAQAAARPGPIYGRLTDIEIYAAIMKGDAPLFIELAEELADVFIREDIEYVAGDAIEGYNPAHDVCRALIDAAVELAGKVKGRRAESFDFLPVGRHDPHHEGPQNGFIRLDLDEAAFNRKLAAASSYSELGAEVRGMMDEMGAAAFQTEYLRLVTDIRRSDDFAGAPPFYETYGEKQVAAGVYRDVIRYREHVFPISEALLDHAQR